MEPASMGVRGPVAALPAEFAGFPAVLAIDVPAALLEVCPPLPLLAAAGAPTTLDVRALPCTGLMLELGGF